MQFTVKEAASLMDFLVKALHGKSRTGIKSLLAKRLVSVDHQVVTKFDLPLKVGQTVIISKKSPVEAAVLRGVSIIYDDDDLVVIEKSAGLLSVPPDTGSEKSALGIVTAHLKRLNSRARLFVVHRLDRDTSGLMMFVKNKGLQAELRTAWQESIHTRRYIALVEGVVAQDKGKIVSWLKGTDGLRTYSSKTPGDGQKAVTHFKVLKRSAAYTLLEVDLETGRKNQIRVHMQDIGHPVAGDDKYGSTQNPVGRLGLHAQILEFTHPKTKKKMSFDAPTPAEFLKLFK